MQIFYAPYFFLKENQELFIKKGTKCDPVREKNTKKIKSA